MTDNTKLTLSQEAIDILSKVTTATLTTLLLKKGLRNVWLRNTKPIRTGQPRLVGRAFTLRFVPAREDLATPEICLLAVSPLWIRWVFKMQVYLVTSCVHAW